MSHKLGLLGRTGQSNLKEDSRLAEIPQGMGKGHRNDKRTLRTPRWPWADMDFTGGQVTFRGTYASG